MNTRSDYDVAIIGAGLSGLAAGIRLAHFGRRVCIFERHNAPGGLNSFYSLAGRKYDVGLHAVTNFVRPGTKGTPLAKVLRQLRIDRDEFDLCEQKRSRIAFGPAGETALHFTNDFAFFESEIARVFPAQAAGFRALTDLVRTTPFGAPTPLSRPILRQHLSEPLLVEMLLCPILFYGGAQAHDLEFSQFAMLFDAIFREGLSRPFAGIRTILHVLLDKYRQAGGERRMKCGVKQIVEQAGRAAALVLDDGTEITATQVISSIGAPETAALVAAAAPPEIGGGPGRISFVETMSIFDRQPAALGWGEDTIVFFNDSPQFAYDRPAGPVDVRSGVICFPNNFEFGGGRQLAEGIFRATCLANYDAWTGQPEAAYRASKQQWFEQVQTSARRFLPPVADSALAAATVSTDMFTPRTIERFTGHRNGTIYGSPAKVHSGATGLANLYLCGTDQGLLGIVGSMLSGIMMANQHVLRKTDPGP